MILKDLIQKTEELSMNALPAIESEKYDGWILRFSEGYTNRGNSIHPLYDSSYDLEEKVAYCEQAYQEKGLNAVYKLTAGAHPASLDRYLRGRGYRISGPTSVQMLSLHERTAEKSGDIKSFEKLDNQWFDVYSELHGMTEGDQKSARKILDSTKGIPSFAMVADEDGRAAGCGFGILEQDHIGIFGIATHPSSRNRGIASQLVTHLLGWGKDRDAKQAYLQVSIHNLPAMGLYKKLGFEEKYLYWYRVKP